MIILKLLKKAQSTPGVAARDPRSGLSVEITNGAPAVVLIKRHGELRLQITGSRISFSNIRTKGELRAFQSVLSELKIPTLLAVGDQIFTTF